MKNLSIVALSVVFGITGYLAVFADTASSGLIGAYVGASCVAVIVSRVVRPWAVRLKWAWGILSLMVVFAVVRGMVTDLRTPITGVL